MCATAVAVLATVPVTAAASPTAADRSAAARAVAAAVPASTWANPDAEPIDAFVGLPRPDRLLTGRAAVMLDPDFWVATVSNLVASGSIVLPAPVDVVKTEAFLPTARVAAGPRTSSLPRRRGDLSDIRYEWQGRTKTVRDFLHTTETDAVAFVHGGRVIGDAYANGWTDEDLHQPWSVTKSFISALVGIAVEEGKVDSVGDPIDAYIDELRGTAWDGVTIRNLLEMESGVHWDENTPVLAVNTQVQQWVQAALDLVTDGALGMGRDEFLASLPKVAEQGTRFSYNSGNTQVLAWLLETVYDKPFAKVLSEKLWRPAGMSADARVTTDRTGHAIASQGLYARVFDLARFGELFRRGGRTPGGRQVVPRAWTRDSTRMTKASKGEYGYQWWAGPTPRSYEASGFQGQKISVSPEHCLVGVRLAHAFGIDTRPDDGPILGPDSYGFGNEFAAAEWGALYRAVAEEVGICRPRAERR